MAASRSSRRRTDVVPVEPPVESPGRFCFGDLDESALDLLSDYLGHPTRRERPWTWDRHFGVCGQGCPCCRYANPEDVWGVCPFCPTHFALKAASRAMNGFVRRHMSTGKVLAVDPGPD